MAKWETFFFDGNSWSGLVDSPEKLRMLTEHYPVHQLERARIAPVVEIGKMPREYHLGAISVRTGDVRSFGFRREHSGEVTLSEWLRARCVSLWQVVEN